MKVWKWVVRLIILSMFLTLGCGCDLRLWSSPEDVTRQWHEAVGAFDTGRMLELTHPERRPRLRAALLNLFVRVMSAIGLQERIYLDMRYDMESANEEIAHVRVTGEVANSLGGYL